MISLEEFTKNLDVFIGKFKTLNTQPDCFGRTPLRTILAEGFPLPYIRVMVGSGAGQDWRGKWSDENALHWAAQGGQKADVIRFLVESGAPVNRHRDAEGTDGRTPLHCAYQNGNAETISALLELGANPKARDCFGRKPFMMPTRA